MNEIYDLIAEHWIVFTTLAYLALSAIVKATPTAKDDQALRKLVEFVSFLAPRDAGRIFSLPGTRVEREEGY